MAAAALGLAVLAGSDDCVQQARYVWGVVDVAISRIESGDADPAAETAAVLAFIEGALAHVLPSWP